jgi:uncharacterized integral membrane protein
MKRRSCSLRTFSIGLRDWLREKSKPTVAQEVAVVYKKTNGFLTPAIVVTIIAVSLLGIVKALQALAGSQALSGLPSSAPLGLGLLATGVAAVYFIKLVFSFFINSLQFAHSMCERGQQILEGTRAPAS